MHYTGFFVGGAPGAMCFDGSSVWVTTYLDNADAVVKIRPSDGATLGAYDVGSHLHDMCYDGTNIWVTDANCSSDIYRLIKLSTDGTILGEATLLEAGQICCDGTSDIWMTNYSSGTVERFKASDLTPNGTISGFPRWELCDVFFDGSSIWVAYGSEPGCMTKVRVSDNAILGTFAMGGGPSEYGFGICFDGTNIWIACGEGQNVVGLRASDGYCMGIFPLNTGGMGICFDGSNLWVAEYPSNTVTKLPAF